MSKAVTSKSSRAAISIRCTHVAGALLERYTYSAGAVEPLPAHTHAAYQLGLSCDSGGEYLYRGARQRVPPGHISIIQSGEPHAPSERRTLPAAATFRMLYLEPDTLAAAATEVRPGLLDTPFFPALSSGDPALVAAFLRLHAVAAAPASRLELDEHLFVLLARLSIHHIRGRTPRRRLLSEHRALLRVRDFLAEHAAANVALNELAQIAGLSRYHLCRSFHSAFGVSPHAYHVQLRIDHAKRLLALGVPPVEVAHATGFADQSHFGRHFRRLVGISPGRYTQ